MISLKVPTRFLFVLLRVFCHSYSLLAIDVFISTNLSRLNGGILLSLEHLAFELIIWLFLFNICSSITGKRLLLGVSGTGIPWRRWSPSKVLLLVFIGATFSLIVDFNDIFELILVLVSLGCFPSSLILFT